MTKRPDDKPQPRSDLEGLCADLDRFGYCIALDLLDDDALVRVRRVVQEEAAGADPDPEPTAETEDWAIRGGDQWVLLMAGECGLDDMVAHETALGLARHLLGENLHLSSFSAHAVHPDNQVMDLHSDQWWLPRPVMPGETPFKPGDITRTVACFGRPEPASHPINPAVVLNFMWAITDFTSANGCTRLVPGSHLCGVEPDPTQDWDTVDAEVPAGGAVIWDARTWHASGKNTVNRPRIGITATYCGPQFRQLQNFTAGLTPAAHAALSDEMKTLLGYKLFTSYGATDTYDTEFAKPGHLRG